MPSSSITRWWSFSEAAWIASISGVGVNAGRGGAGVVGSGGLVAEGACAKTKGAVLKHIADTATARTAQRKTGNNAGMMAADLEASEIESRGKNIDLPASWQEMQTTPSLSPGQVFCGPQAAQKRVLPFACAHSDEKSGLRRSTPSRLRSRCR
jgi:hypothetical protein